jgi:hypothetical protein
MNMTPHIEDALVAPPNQSSYLVISLYFSPQALFSLQIHLMIVFPFKLRNLYVNNSHHPSSHCLPLFSSQLVFFLKTSITSSCLFLLSILSLNSLLPLFNLYNIFKSSKHSSDKKILFSHSFTCLHSSRVSLN